jgi:hypothetical protein
VSSDEWRFFKDEWRIIGDAPAQHPGSALRLLLP